MSRRNACSCGAPIFPSKKKRASKPNRRTIRAAYEAYLRGRAFAFAAGSQLVESDPDGAIRSFQEAVKLDPSFALAWAYLSCVQSERYWVDALDASPARLAAAKDALDHALALGPDLPETHLALGYYRYYGRRDFTGALEEFRRAEQTLPNDFDITFAIATIQRRLGHWEEAIAQFRRAIQLNARNVHAYNQLALTYAALRRFPEALATADRVLAWDPAEGFALGMKASVFWARGDLEAVEPLLANPGFPPRVRGMQALLQRRYADAIQSFSGAIAVDARGRPGRKLKLLLALSQQRSGDSAAARATYQKAAQDFQRELGEVVPGSPAEAGAHAALGIAHAGLGDAASAVAEGQTAMAMYSTSKDPVAWPRARGGHGANLRSTGRRRSRRSHSQAAAADTLSECVLWVRLLRRCCDSIRCGTKFATILVFRNWPRRNSHQRCRIVEAILRVKAAVQFWRFNASSFNALTRPLFRRPQFPRNLAPKFPASTSVKARNDFLMKRSQGRPKQNLTTYENKNPSKGTAHSYFADCCRYCCRHN